MLLLGCDFTCAPSARKPIVVAIGEASSGAIALSSLHTFATLDAWAVWLRATPGWIGAFDFPFGLPRELVQAMGWPLRWEAWIARYAALSRAEIRERFAAFCAARPAGGKFAHRATDGPAGSSPSMKWVNPPVAFMLHAGVPRLLAAGAVLPGLHEPAGADRRRVALEGYPGLLARELIGRRSYKSDTIARQDGERLAARADMLTALTAGTTRLGLRLSLDSVHYRLLLADARGDHLDAVLCLMQAAWAAGRAAGRSPGYGLPSGMDPLEGWIVSA